MHDQDQALRLEASLCWGDQVLSVQHFDQPRQVTIGPTDRADFFADAPELEAAAFPIVRHRDGRYLLTIDPTMRGEVQGSAGTMVLTQLPGEPDGELPECRCAPLPLDSTTTIAFGALTLQLRFVPAPAPLASWLASEPNYGLLNVALVSLFVHVGVFAAAWLYPIDIRALTEDLLTGPGRTTATILVPPTPVPSVRQAAPEQPGASGLAAERHQKSAGLAGTRDAREADRRMAFAGPKPTTEAIVAGRLASLFGTTEAGLSGVFGAVAGSDLVDAMGHVTGPTVGAARGLGGLGLRGDGPGGGGHDQRTYGVGAIGTIGHGTGGRPWGTGSIGGSAKVDRGPEITQRTVIVGDALSRDIIRRVIREHINEVRYCYERELQQTPGLWGKVQIRFVIGASGAVRETSVVENTVAGDAVAGCVSSRVRGWRFPRPRGGGVVIVSYPFLFKQGG